MRQKSRKPSYTVAAMIAATLFAKALGLLRSALLARTLGDLPEAAAFAAASGIPGAVFDILFSAAITGAFIPAYSAAREEGGKSAADFSRSFLGAALAAASLFALLGAVFAPAVIRACAPRLGGATAELAVHLLRIMFPSAVFTAGAYTLAGLLQAKGSFILPAAVSALSNVCIAAYILLSRERFSVYALSAVYVFSWLLQLLTLALPLIFRGEMPAPRIDLRNKHLLRALRSVPKIAAGAWLSPASVLAAAFFCSFVSEKSFVIYSYALGIYTVAAGAAVYGVGNYCFPALSSAYARGERELFAERLCRAVFSALALAVPVFCAVLALAPECIALLYARGNFTAEAAEACALALRALSPAIPAYAVSEVLYRAFCAAEKPRAAALSSLFALITLVASNVISLALGGGTSGVCASLAIAEWAHALFLFLYAKKNFRAFRLGKALWLAPGGALCLASIAVCGRILPNFSIFTPSISIFLKITIVFTAGVVVYLLYILVLSSRGNAKKPRQNKRKEATLYYAEKKEKTFFG